jgi:hypothetical protein
MLAAFLERGIGPPADQLAEPLPILRREDGRVAAAMGLGLERAGGAVGPQQPGDEGGADQEPLSDPADGTVTAPHHLEDPLSEILRVGFHRSPPYPDLPSNRAPSNCSAL